MSENRSPHYILLLLFTVNVFLGVISNFELSRFNRLFPNLNVMYTLKPVRHMYPTLTGTCTHATSSYCPSVAAVRDAVADGVAVGPFSILQISKYKMGCYGDLPAFKTQDEYADYNALVPNAKADHLNIAQHAAGGFQPSSACKCIDDVVRKLVKDTVTMTGLYDNIHPDVTNEYDNIWQNSAYTGAYGVVNTKIDIPSDLAADIDSDDKADLHRHVAEFCSSTGAPQFTYQYEGVVDASLLALVGQLLVVVGIAMEYVMRWKNESLDKKKEEGITGPNIAIAVLSFLSALLVILLFVYFPDNYKTDDRSIVGYRSAGKTKIERFQQAIMSGAVIFVLINALIQFIAGASILYKKTDSKKDRENGMNSALMGSYSMLFAYDMQQTIGWALVIAAFAIQTNVKNIGTIAAFVFVIAGAGTLQYCSNMLKTLYNKTLAGTSPEDIAALQTKADPGTTNKGKAQGPYGQEMDFDNVIKNPHLEHLRGFLRFIGWGRLFIFVSVFILSVFGITLARESTVGSHVQSLYEGRLLYALLAFLVGTIGIDVVLEIVPLQFIYESDGSGDKKLSDAYAYNIRYYFIALYFLWLNLSSLSLFRYETKDEWHTVHAATA